MMECHSKTRSLKALTDFSLSLLNRRSLTLWGASGCLGRTAGSPRGEELGPPDHSRGSKPSWELTLLDKTLGTDT